MKSYYSGFWWDRKVKIMPREPIVWSAWKELLEFALEIENKFTGDT